ncbi:hypothetical protein [Emticicia agri]|uniref:hypothetical protein n=1 Tax=Emticicia agri TaxID=2492393 RepID=UPI0013EC606A|nr:hypothetical protein [Emticicia agri]
MMKLLNNPYNMTTVDTILSITAICLIAGIIRYVYVKRNRRSYYDKFLRRRVVKEI